MSNVLENARSRANKWGWGILLVMSVLVSLNGVVLYFISASPTIFEQDTGVPKAEVMQTYPTVADEVVREGRITSILLIGLGALALVVALAGYRLGSRWTWNAMWVLVGTLAVSFLFITMEGRFDIGVFYLVMVVITLIGQLLARRGVIS